MAVNVLYMHSHDTGKYIEPYGYAVSTPNLLKLAKEGTLFRRAFSMAPTCCPSRAGQFTGMVPHAAGMLGLVNRGFRMPEDHYRMHLANFLSEHGYETVLCGVQHEIPAENRHLLGYRVDYADPKLRTGNKEKDDMFRAACAAEFLGRQHDRPFFMSVGFSNTHRPFAAIADDIDPDYVIPPFPLPDTPETRMDMAGYMSSARVLDRCVGMVMDALDKSGLSGETLVIYTTDHGVSFPYMKSYLFDTGTGVSLIVRHPDPALNRKSLDALVSHIDLFPTLCDALRLPKPPWLHGTSLLPLLTGEADSVNRYVFGELSYHVGYSPMRSVRSERYKLIRHYDDYGRWVISNTDDGPSKTFMVDHGLAEETKDREMLFDLYLDPAERVNRVRDPRLTAVYTELCVELDDWMRRTGDPVLTGKVPKPPGARITKQTCISQFSQDFEE